jgi:hypothetical protein
VLNACATMPAPAKDSYLVYKIAFLQNLLFKVYKDIVPLTNGSYKSILMMPPVPVISYSMKTPRSCEAFSSRGSGFVY